MIDSDLTSFYSVCIILLGLYIVLMAQNRKRAGSIYNVDDNDATLAHHGEEGERDIDRRLRESGIPTLRNLYLRGHNGQWTEVDLAALIGGQIVIIEVKAWRGMIIGDADDPEWTQLKRFRRPVFLKNPLLQNEHHLRAAKMALPRASFLARVVVLGGNFPNGLPERVVAADGLPEFLNKYRGTLPNGATLFAWGKLSSWSGRQDKAQLKQLHLARIYRRRETMT